MSSRRDRGKQGVGWFPYGSPRWGVKIRTLRCRQDVPDKGISRGVGMYPGFPFGRRFRDTEGQNVRTR